MCLQVQVIDQKFASANRSLDWRLGGKGMKNKENLKNIYIGLTK